MKVLITEEGLRLRKEMINSMLNKKRDLSVEPRRKKLFITNDNDEGCIQTNFIKVKTPKIKISEEFVAKYTVSNQKKKSPSEAIEFNAKQSKILEKHKNLLKIRSRVFESIKKKIAKIEKELAEKLDRTEQCDYFHIPELKKQSNKAVLKKHILYYGNIWKRTNVNHLATPKGNTTSSLY